MFGIPGKGVKEMNDRIEDPHSNSIFIQSDCSFWLLKKDRAVIYFILLDNFNVDIDDIIVANYV